MIKHIHIAISLLLFHNIAFSQQKHVIGSWHGGLFSAFLVVVNHLGWCEQNHKTPVIYWDRKSLYYSQNGFNGSRNAWEYYFEPVSDLKYNQGDTIFIDYALGKWGGPVWRYPDVDQANRDKAHQIISKYIKFNTIVATKIESFYQQHMIGNRTIGIHHRATDKRKEEPTIPTERLIQAALEQADQNTQFLIASDDQKILDKMITLLKGRKVIYYDCYRSNNGRPLHYRKPKPIPAQLGEDVVVEVGLMAKCDVLVHNLSNVSTAALYFNPFMKAITLQ